MVKKTKIKKGGKTFLERRLGLAEGSLVTDDVDDRIKSKKASALLDEYRLRRDVAQLDYDIAQNRKDHADDLNEKLKDRNFKYDKLNNENSNKKLKLLGDFINALGKSIGYIFDKFIYIITKLFPTYFVIARDTVFSLFSLIREYIGTGQGAIVKVLILVIIFVGVITGLVFLFGGSSGDQKSALNKTSLNVFTKTPTPSFTGTFNTAIKGFIPDSFTRHLNSINSRFNNILGKDIKATSVNRIARDVVKDNDGRNDGRHNGITNIKIENDNNIHSIIKPKDAIKISLDLNDYKDDNIDFYKLPVKVQNDLKKSYETTSINFNLKRIKNNKGENNKGEIYKYEVDNINSDILENDKFIINKFNIISPDIDVVKIKEKDKKNYMFKFNGDKFVYPENIGTNNL
jgi:hypothetical protein